MEITRQRDFKKKVETDAFLNYLGFRKNPESTEAEPHFSEVDPAPAYDALYIMRMYQRESTPKYTRSFEEVRERILESTLRRGGIYGGAIWLELTLNLDELDPLYLELWLKTKIGQTWLRTIGGSGTLMRNLSWQDFDQAKIPVPTLTAQREYVRAILEIQSLEEEIAQNRRKIEQSPTDAGSLIENSLVRLETEDSLASWENELPYPLAVMLRSYRVTQVTDVHERSELLLDFFEVTSLILLNIYLSAGITPESTFNPETIKLEKGVRDIKLASFGAWTKWGADLAAEIRRTQQEDRESVSQAFRLDTNIVTKLLSKRIWATLEQAKVLRAGRAHGRTRGKSGIADANEIAEQLLLDLRRELAGVFESVRFLRQESAIRSDTTGRYQSKCRVLVSSNSIFELTELNLVEGLFENRIYLNQEGVDDALLLLPLVSLTSHSSTQQTRVIFFDRFEGDSIIYTDKLTSDDITINMEEEPSIKQIKKLFLWQRDA